MDERFSVEAVSIDRLHPNPANPRLNDEAVPHVAASLRRFGWQQPIVAKPSGEVIAGHTRLKAARSLGMTEVPVVWFRGSELDATAFGIADNRTHEFAEWDEPALARLLSELREEDGLEGVGFDASEIDALLASFGEGEQELPDPGPQEPPENPLSRPGDVWLLGRHRLVCGDATSRDDVRAALGEHAPLLMVTDPPYGVRYDPGWRNEAGVSKTARTGKVQNDDRFDWTDAWALFPGDVAYVWHAGRFCGEVALSLATTGLLVRAQVIWAKSRFALSRGHYHWQHEPCWYAVREGASAHWIGDRKQSTIWSIPSTDDGQTTRHGTQKPIDCMARPMRNHSSDVVYDPFLGSGTSIIAAEQLGRICVGLEIDPGYCDAILRRYEAATGLEARTEQGETLSSRGIGHSAEVAESS